MRKRLPVEHCFFWDYWGKGLGAAASRELREALCAVQAVLRCKVWLTAASGSAGFVCVLLTWSVFRRRSKKPNHHQCLRSMSSQAPASATGRHHEVRQWMESSLSRLRDYESC